MSMFLRMVIGVDRIRIVIYNIDYPLFLALLPSEQ
jgi:hypothetical protein